MLFLIAIRFWPVYGTEKISSNRFLSRFVTSEAFRFYRNLCKVSILQINRLIDLHKHAYINPFHLYFQSNGFKTTCRKLETQPKGSGIQYRRHTRLHCTRSE